MSNTSKKGHRGVPGAPLRRLLRGALLAPGPGLGLPPLPGRQQRGQLRHLLRHLEGLQADPGL